MMRYDADFLADARVVAPDELAQIIDAASGGTLKTWVRPMDMCAAASRALAIPIILGFFGIAIAIISAILR